MKQFFQAREGLPTAASADASLRTSFVNALLVQINTMPDVGPAEAASLTDALKDSPYGEEGVAELVAAIDRKLQAHRPISSLKARIVAIHACVFGVDFMWHPTYMCVHVSPLLHF